MVTQPFRPHNSSWTLAKSLYKPLTEINLLHKKITAESISYLNSVKHKNALCIFMHSSLLVFDPQKVRLFATPWTRSLTGSSLHGILQTRILEWVAISFSRGSSQPRDQTRSPAFQADALTSEPPGKPPEMTRRPKSVLKELPVIGGRFQNSNCCDGASTGFSGCKRQKERLSGGGIAHAES